PALPRLALMLEHRERGVVPVVRGRSFIAASGSGTGGAITRRRPLRDRREDELGRLLHRGFIARAPQELLDEHCFGGHRGGWRFALAVRIVAGSLLIPYIVEPVL